MTRQRTKNSFHSFLYEQRQNRLFDQNAHKKRLFKFEMELQNKRGRSVSLQFRKLLREKIYDQWYGPTIDEVEAEAKEKWAAKSKTELDNISERLDFCPRCSVLAIRPEFVWGTWLCLYCYLKFSRSAPRLPGRHLSETEGMRFLFFLCKEVELIATGKQPQLWLRRKLPSDPVLRKAIIRESRRKSDKIEPRVYPHHGVFIDDEIPLGD